MGPGVLLLLGAVGAVVGWEAGRRWDYVVLGSGPAGLQAGYYLQQAGCNYVILERNNSSGSFFQTYPRHDKLISINKRFTGKTNKEFNLRHDWNSLLSDSDELKFRQFSDSFFPNRSDMHHYLNHYQRTLGLNVRYNTDIGLITKPEANNTENQSKKNSPLLSEMDHQFVLHDQRGHLYSAKVLLLATGMWRPHVPASPSLQQVAEGYEDMPTDPHHYTGQNILILGHGNSAFETADSLYGNANLVHMVGRSRVRLAWETHYVGDVRGVNNGILDTYQLKSLDGILEGNLEDIHFRKEDDKIWISLMHEGMDNFALRTHYDRVIRCLGFTFDFSVFDKTTRPPEGGGEQRKFPLVLPDHQVAGVSHMYVLGAAAHSLDFRRSSGGFIHGFRHQVDAFRQLLGWRYHGTRWPATTLPLPELLPHLVRRINEAPGLYQMFGVLGDVITFNQDGISADYLTDFPLSLLPNFTAVTGSPLANHVVLVMQYGLNYSGPGKDVFRESRATGFASDAHKSNFLHPVLYYYRRPITVERFAARPTGWALPRPSRLHHVVEDFLVHWMSPRAHLLPLRRFLEYVVHKDLRNFTPENCLQRTLTSLSPPIYCQYANHNYEDSLQYIEPDSKSDIHQHFSAFSL